MNPIVTLRSSEWIETGQNKELSYQLGSLSANNQITIGFGFRTSISMVSLVCCPPPLAVSLMVAFPVLLSEWIETGQNKELSYQLGSLSANNQIKLEVSRIPSVDISRPVRLLI